MAVEALRLDGFEALGLLLMSKQQAAHLGHPLPPLLCLLHCQSLHAFRALWAYNWCAVLPTNNPMLVRTPHPGGGWGGGMVSMQVFQGTCFAVAGSGLLRKVSTAFSKASVLLVQRE